MTHMTRMTVTDLLSPGVPLLLSETAAASVLGVSQPTLNRHARRGTLPSGIRPIWVTPSRRMYSTRELLAYLGLPTAHLFEAVA